MIAKNPDLRLGTNGAPTTLTNLNDYVKSVEFPRSIETFDKTTFSQSTNTRQMETGFQSITMSLNGLWKPDMDAHLHDLVSNGTEVDYQFGPEGSASGKIKYTGKAVVTNYSNPVTVGEQITFTAELHINTLTRGAYA